MEILVGSSLPDSKGGGVLVIQRFCFTLLLLFCLPGMTVPAAGRDKAGVDLDFTVITYNIRVGHGPESARQPERTGEFLTLISHWINAEGADLVLLQEVDQHAERSLRYDQAQLLGIRTGMHAAFSPALEHRTGGYYGVAVLSRWPITSWRADNLFKPHLPDSPPSHSEQRIVQVVEIDTPAGPMHLLNTHLGLTQAQRFLQLFEIAQKIDDLPEGEPIVFGGDLNARPEAPELIPIRQRLHDAYEVAPVPPAPNERLTIPSLNPTACIDYIFLSPGRITVRDVHVPREITYSDHLPVVAHLTLHAGPSSGSGMWVLF